MKDFRIIGGLLVWAIVACGMYWIADKHLVTDGGIRSRLVPQLWQHITSTNLHIDLQINEPIRVGVGDSIFVINGPRNITQVGEIAVVIDPKSQRPIELGVTDKAEAFFYPSTAGITADSRLTYYTSSQSMAWVVQTMMPPNKRKRIGLELTAAVERHQAEILQTLRPVIENALYEAIKVVEADLDKAITRHRPAIERLGSRYQSELIEKKIVPLVKREIWPIVQTHAEPTANQIGIEIWKRVSLWRFGWRYLYDTAPLPERNRFQKEWIRFVDQEIVPVLENHSEELVGVVQQVLADAVRNKTVRSAIRENMAQIIEDVELQEIVWRIVREVTLENPRLREALDKQFQGPDAQKAFQLTATRFEPMVRRIGDLLFGTRESGITPEFARVLRNQILGKDRHWFVVEKTAAANEAPQRSGAFVLQVHRGEMSATNPFIPSKPRVDDVHDR